MGAPRKHSQIPRNTREESCQEKETDGKWVPKVSRIHKEEEAARKQKGKPRKRGRSPPQTRKS